MSVRAVAEQRLAPSLCNTARGRKISPAPAAASLATTSKSCQEHPVGRAPDTGRTPVEDVGVDHRGVDVTVTEQFFHGQDVVVVLQEARPLSFSN